MDVALKVIFKNENKGIGIAKCNERRMSSENKKVQRS